MVLWVIGSKWQEWAILGVTRPPLFFPLFKFPNITVYNFIRLCWFNFFGSKASLYATLGIVPSPNPSNSRILFEIGIHYGNCILSNTSKFIHYHQVDNDIMLIHACLIRNAFVCVSVITLMELLISCLFSTRQQHYLWTDPFISFLVPKSVKPYVDVFSSKSISKLSLLFL